MSDSEQDAIDSVDAEMAALGIEREEVEPAETTTETTETAPAETEDPQTPPEVSNRDEDDVELSKVNPRTLKEYKQDLRSEIQKDFDDKFEKLKQEMSKEKPNEITTQETEDDIAKLAEELDFDPEKTRRIIEVARKGVKTLSEDDEALLAEVKTMREERQKFLEDTEQKEIFEAEWKQAFPELRKQFPNATEEQIQKAKDELDELAHSEKYHDKDIDYILFKEKDAIGKTLFSPKQATFESSRPISFDTDDDFPEFREGMTPAQFEAFQKSRERMESSLEPERLRITTRDDRGQIVERYE